MTIQRMTLFKVLSPENIPPFLAEYQKLQSAAVKVIAPLQVQFRRILLSSSHFSSSTQKANYLHLPSVLPGFKTLHPLRPSRRRTSGYPCPRLYPSC